MAIDAFQEIAKGLLVTFAAAPSPEAIRDMPAGREMDEFVATRVMGWYKGDIGHWYDDEHNRKERCEDSDDYYGHAPRWMPSEFLGDAGMVIAKLCERFANLALRFGNGSWTCVAWDVGPLGAKNGSPSVGNGNTAALAVCRCALLSLWESKP